jgi:hypothetical protein
MMITVDFESLRWSAIWACDLPKFLRIKIIAIVFDECSRLELFDLLDMMWFDEEMREQEGFEKEGVDEII